MTAFARIPRRITFGAQMSTMISVLLRQGKDGSVQLALNADPTLRRVLGYPLPKWQRERVWTDSQSARFIESVYAGVNIGTFVYNETVLASPFNGLLIDGQQRLGAIKRYVADEFAVSGEDGIARVWSELTDEEQRHFGRMQFGFSIVRHEDEASLVELYNLLNFGGTAHRPEERAEL